MYTLSLSGCHSRTALLRGSIFPSVIPQACSGIQFKILKLLVF
ncbi:hypothetical protein [Rickettsia tamurae]|nr:hypothetical protein [Rickettsia tamurae]